MSAKDAKNSKQGKSSTILVVDDDADICIALEMLLTYEGYTVWTAKNGRQALQRLDMEAGRGKRADLVLSDVKMPEIDGLELLEKMLERDDAPPMVMISGHADIATAVAAIKKGALDFLEKPLDQTRVLLTIGNSLRANQLRQENAGLRRQLDQRWDLVGSSAPMQRLREEIDQLAQAEVPVLVTGENGTGKEVVARNLHLCSSRAAGPFVAVNCAAIPGELVESELFGHERGSFTGAHDRRLGHFESAHQGTLFLDEVGDMPLAAQAKLLRALETREITRVGGTEPVQVDIRVVAATNADLERAVEEKTFRMDLFYRLNVVPLHVPALRERLEDVPLLAERFLELIATRTGRAAPPINPDALEILGSLPYPGNVRQLKNLIEAAHVFADDAITGADVQRILNNGPSLSSPRNGTSETEDPFAAETFEAFKNESEALFFRRKLEENSGNVKRTAEQLSMQRSHLYKKLDRYDLK
ncbi:MAG: two-component system nitrogen regulation response regulator NtrX [Planctomycetota bacterium]|jgi:two-component system nitrogen regulation response regulator NtrX